MSRRLLRELMRFDNCRLAALIYAADEDRRKELIFNYFKHGDVLLFRSISYLLAEGCGFWTISYGLRAVGNGLRLTKLSCGHRAKLSMKAYALNSFFLKSRYLGACRSRIISYQRAISHDPLPITHYPSAINQ